MRRVSTGLSVLAIGASIGCFVLQAVAFPASAEAAALKPDFSAAGVDMMPIGTPKQMARFKRARATRKA